MKRFSEQLNKKSQTVKLRAAEKRDLRERVVSYMEYHPLPAEMRAKPASKVSKLLTEEYRTVAVPFGLIGKWAFAATVMVLVFLPIAAERSVPGDGLYAMKRFNEEVRGTLVFDTVQKVEWETERLNRRIAEARLLASEGRLTNEVEEEVAAAVRTHSANAQKNIDVLRGEDADEATLASIALETTLAVQSAALNEDADAEQTDNTTESNVATPSILATAVEETRARANVNNASSTIPAFDKVMAKVEINTTRVYELRDSLIGTASKEQVAEITRRMEDIERAVVAAIALRSTDDKTARADLVGALQRTQKLIVFMTDIEVSQNVDIEKLVPVVLTPDEEAVILADLAAELETRLTRIKATLAETTDLEFIEKTNTIVTEIELLQVERAGTSTFANEKSSLQEALLLADNIYTLLEIEATERSEIEKEALDIVVDERATTTPATATSTPTSTIAVSPATSTEESATTSVQSVETNTSSESDTTGVVSTTPVDDE